MTVDVTQTGQRPEMSWLPGLFLTDKLYLEAAM
jgi:hypothetical protein